MKTLPRVSFIIPTLNASKLLPKCLAKIREQDYPKNKIEIIVVDGGSTDGTQQIANSFGAIILKNPKILHEPGKTLASKKAKGDILFYTDSDNILSHNNWLRLMVQPYIDNPSIMGFLPQTIPAPDSNGLDRYLGYLCTDPFTWFIYNEISSGRKFPKIYTPVLRMKEYIVYKFPTKNPPLFGLSQGVGTNRKFKRDQIGYSDDLLAGIKLIKEEGLVAYVPNAGVYHYHVSGIINYIKKYRWRVRNNLKQEVKGMGLVNRQVYFGKQRKLKMWLFIPYVFSLIFPIIDSIRLIKSFKDIVMLWHIPATLFLGFVIIFEGIRNKIFRKQEIGSYE